MKKSVFRILVCVLILSLALPAASNTVLAEVSEPPAPTPSAVESERFEPDWNFLKEGLYPPGLAELYPGEGDVPELREYTPSSPEVIALTQQQVQSFDCSTVTDVPEVECEALVAFYESTNGAGWTNKTNWLASTTVGNWFGVTLESGHVIYLQLSNNHLSGYISPDLGNMNNLQRLTLSLNQLSGFIPPELGSLTYLQYLFLDINQLIGSIPPEIGNLSNLQYLVSHQNHLTGSIPSELGNMTNLKTLMLTRNELTGPIPPELGNLTNLLGLYLGQNTLRGPIPTELGNLTNLLGLTLSFNELEGSIPTQICSLVSLQELHLHSNQLSGQIPTCLGNLINLKKLNIGGNILTGTVPEELGNLTNLEYLGLYNNLFNGSIPTWMGDLTSLKELNLSGCQFTGIIPTELGNLTSLETLSLGGNPLTGSIPQTLGNLGNLKHLFLGYMQLSGPIPPEFGSLINLQYLYLMNNQLSNQIPFELGNLSSLVNLDLSDNQLSGPIPPDIGNLVNLISLNISDNTLSGEVPASLTNLVNLCEPGNTNPPCYGYYETDLGYNHLNVPALEPGVEDFLAIKDPDWYLTQAVEEEIPGDTGGIVISNDGNTELDIPAGAADGMLTILFAPQPNPGEDIGGLNFAGNSFELTAFIGEDPVESFAQPLTLTLQYDQASLGVIPEDTLILYYWDTTELAWLDAASTCPGGSYTRDLDADWLSLPICHLSEFALLGDSFDLFLPAITR